MKIKKRINKKIGKIIIITIAFVLIFILSLNFIVWRMDEDTWIKDSRGVYVMHGKPSQTPGFVLVQQEAILCAYGKFDNLNEEINSQCLGICGDYAIDIVHVPRIRADNFAENQCADYANGKVSHFIELNQKGEVVGIV